MGNESLRPKWLGRQRYGPFWKKMQRQAESMSLDLQCKEALWLCEHDPVYTTGRRGKDNRMVVELPAPLVHVDRGGETTFHGPGQILLYPILRLNQRNIGVRQYVYLMEQSCLNFLASYGVEACRRSSYPGVWMSGGKVAAMGLRVRHGICYHGMALNVQVNLSYFGAIDPCGLGLSAVNMYAPDHPLGDELGELGCAWADAFLELME